ncbi:hypothetical protein ACH518_11625 [Methylomonas sp. HW2-6]|uniref:hypothetical protein n=1 Tax=Methylomonas TaxID=416 RepID=UPI00112E8579|nr:hypothetical protein [Methylomonas koyamae]
MIETVLATVTLGMVFCWRTACRQSAAMLEAGPERAAVCAARSRSLPEDAVLRRHFLAQINSEIQAGLAPCPSDSVLRRHHQALVSAKLQQALAELGRSPAC